MNHVLKALIPTSLSLAALLVGGAAFGQSEAKHDVTIKLPEVVQIRITNGTDNTAVTSAEVVFGYDDAAGTNTYMAAIEAGTPLAPTLAGFGDIVVFVNRGGWYVNVEAEPFTYTGTGVAGGLALSDIVVRPSGGAAGTVSGYNLTTTANIASGGTVTDGYHSLGISGDDYELVVDGDEVGGTYETIVTYTLTAP